MANRLYTLGGWAYEHRRRVVALWAMVLVGVIAAAMAFGGKTNDKFEVPGTESQEAQQLLEEKYPAASGTYARLVFKAPEGEKLTDAENREGIEATLHKAAKSEDVMSVTNPYETGAISKDGTIGYADVIYPVTADKIEQPARDELEASGDPAKEAGMQVEFGGGLLFRVFPPPPPPPNPRRREGRQGRRRPRDRDRRQRRGVRRGDRGDRAR